MKVKFLFNTYDLEKRSGLFDNCPKFSSSKIIQYSIPLLGLKSAVNLNDLYRMKKAWIVCSPEQFVKWLVWRKDNGFMNSMRELEISLVEDDGSATSVPVVYSND